MHVCHFGVAPSGCPPRRPCRTGVAAAPGPVGRVSFPGHQAVRRSGDVGGQGSLYGSFSDHIANGCIVVGDLIPGGRGVAFEDVRLCLTDADRELASVVGDHPFDNPVLPVVVGVNRMRRHRGVKAGAVIVTNSSTTFFPVRAETVIRAVDEDLGEVSATFAA